jgi:hypothetical protein
MFCIRLNQIDVRPQVFERCHGVAGSAAMWCRRAIRQTALKALSGEASSPE